MLKLIGDGTLAIFRADDPAAACAARSRPRPSCAAASRELNERRTAEERPTTSVYLGLHIGDVFYGNIGSDDRLDFTVVGPAVNEVSRIASMCRSVDRPLLISSDFADATARAPSAPRSSRSAASRCAASGGPRSSSRSIPRFCRDRQ